MKCKLTRNEPSCRLLANISVTQFFGSIGGILLADHMMWLQYVANVGSAPEQVEVPGIRTSVRRMSRTIILLENENDQGAAVVPEEQGFSAETAEPPQASNGTDNDEVVSKGNKMSFFVKVGNSMVTGAIAIGYPIAVLPYYRADSTTE